MVALLFGSIRAKKVSRAVKIRFLDKWVRSSHACGGTNCHEIYLVMNMIPVLSVIAGFGPSEYI